MVVFFDIDGTLVEESSQIIPESAIRAIRRLRENGHVPVINTGRPYSHLDPRILAMPFGGWVCGAGMEIFLEDRWLQRYAMSRELSRQVIDMVRACKMQVIYEVEGGFYLDGDLSIVPQVTEEARRMEIKGFFVRQLAQIQDPILIKLVTYDGPGCQRQRFLDFMAQHFTCIDRGNTMVEFVRAGCSKAAGMELLLQALGMARQDTYAIGDSTNDLPMFRAAGHAICMGNGMEEAKAAAEYITDTVLADGVEKALAHYGLI